MLVTYLLLAVCAHCAVHMVVFRDYLGGLRFFAPQQWLVALMGLNIGVEESTIDLSSQWCRAECQSQTEKFTQFWNTNTPHRHILARFLQNFPDLWQFLLWLTI